MNDKLKIAFRHALIYFFISTAFFLIYYIVNPNLIFGWMTYILPVMAILIYFVVRAIQSYRKKLGGRINFGPAFVVGILTWLFAALIGGVFNILFEIVDPEFTEFSKDSAIEMAEGMMEKFGAPESSIEEALEKMEDQDFSAKGTFFKNLLNSLIAGSIFSAIIALVFHLMYRRRPEDDVVIQE